MEPRPHQAERQASQPCGDLQLQCWRILRCTAEAFANSPGGFCFQPGTRPWLEGLAGAVQVHAVAVPAAAVNPPLALHQVDSPPRAPGRCAKGLKKWPRKRNIRRK